MMVQVEMRDPEGRENRNGPLEAVIGEAVLHRLGQPDQLHQVQVRRVFAGKYRVNVFVRTEGATFKVAHSYFLEADEEGQILSATPALTRIYGSDGDFSPSRSLCG